MPRERVRGFCFTVNNYDDEDIAWLMNMYEEDTGIKYMILGFEEADRTGTLHIQGYVYYTNPQEWKYVKACLGDNHIEAQKSKSNVAAYCYCMEDYDYYEMGNRPRQGHRTDLEVIRHDLIKKKPMVQIADEYFSQWCQYRRSFDAYKDLKLRYDTIFIVYDPDSFENIKKLYSDYNLENALVIQTQYEFTPTEIMHKYHSKKYTYIAYPNHRNIPEFFTQTNYINLCNMYIED